MGIYDSLSYEQLKIILKKYPNDVDAKKRVEQIEKTVLNTSDFPFLFGCVLFLFAVLIWVFKMFGFFEMINDDYVVFCNLIGFFFFIIRLYDYVLKKELKNSSKIKS